MRYRYRYLRDGERAVGAFVDLGDSVATVLFADYFIEIPRRRAWKRPATLDAASSVDLEPEVVAAHPAITVAANAWTDDLSPDPSSVRGAEGETAIHLAAYRAVRNWLRARTS
ncbi:MAG: hypothetical protein Q8O33_13320 [Pseudomonadota bacterium]|nr:hypothetical protein [Pseudomonadota bacterium]